MTEGASNSMALVLAAVLVIACGGAMAIVGENQLPSLPEEGYLEYALRENTQIHQFGDYGVDFHLEGDWYHTTMGWWGNMEPEDYSRLPMGLGFGGMYLDTVHLNTSWGEKVVDRYIGMVLLESSAAFGVEYRGTDSDLVYRSDIIGQEKHIEVKLIKTDFSVIKEMDLEERGDRVVEVLHRHPHSIGTIFNQGGAISTLLEPLPEQIYSVHFHSENTVLYTFGEKDLYTMVDGGCFSYDHERSLVGNGSLDFVIEEGLVFFWFAEDGHGAPFGRVTIDVLEA